MNSLIVFGTRLANIFTVSFKSNLNYLVFKVASRGIHNLLRTSNLFMYEILTDTQIYRWDENYKQWHLTRLFLFLLCSRHC